MSLAVWLGEGRECSAAVVEGAERRWPLNLGSYVY